MTAEPPIYDPFRKHEWTTPTQNFSAKLVSYDPDVVLPIIDETFYCHIGYWEPDLKTVMVIPRQYGRKGNSLYLHGPDLHTHKLKDKDFTSESRLYRLIEAGRVQQVCATITLLDALALARSATHAAISYRSVVIYGSATAVTDDAEKADALKVLCDHIAPGYSGQSRPSTAEERQAVGIIRIDFAHVSAKTRVGGPSSDDRKGHEDPKDKWAGLVPVRPVYGPPITASYVPAGVAVPDYVRALTGIRGGNTLVVDPPVHSAGESTQDERPPGAPLI
ncbi:pyridoxamine 5'-phosphate oxidase family protein [Actinokineospora sp. NPDC004072]